MYFDQTVGNILRRQGIALAPERNRTTTWSQFIRVFCQYGEDFERGVVSSAKEDSNGQNEREDDLEHETTLLVRSNGASPGRRCEIASC
jgi:hypothetical protein